MSITEKKIDAPNPLKKTLNRFVKIGLSIILKLNLRRTFAR